MTHAKHFRGKVNPENPPETSTVVILRHDLHAAVKCDALDDNTDAEITIPGILTSFDIIEAWIHIK